MCQTEVGTDKGRGGGSAGGAEDKGHMKLVDAASYGSAVRDIAEAHAGLSTLHQHAEACIRTIRSRRAQLAACTTVVPEEASKPRTLTPVSTRRPAMPDRHQRHRPRHDFRHPGKRSAMRPFEAGKGQGVTEDDGCRSLPFLQHSQPGPVPSVPSTKTVHSSLNVLDGLFVQSPHREEETPTVGKFPSRDYLCRLRATLWIVG